MYVYDEDALDSGVCLRVYMGYVLTTWIATSFSAFVFTRVHMYLHMYMHTYVCIYAIYLSMHTYIHIYAYIRT